MANQTRPSSSLLKRSVAKLLQPVIGTIAHSYGLHTLQSRVSQATLDRAKKKLEHGEQLRIVGLGCGGHNTGVGLVTADRDTGIRVICNHEEERFVGQKHCKDFPEFSFQQMQVDLQDLQCDLGAIDGFVCTWDYVNFFSNLCGHIVGELPGSLTLLRREASPTFSTRDIGRIFRAPQSLAKQVSRQKNAPQAHPIICLRHHDSHAFSAYGLSPFAQDGHPTLVAVIDGTGDDGSISLYRADQSGLHRFYSNKNIFDSIGQMFLYISSCQGGWAPLSSEGRYMGAAAWGNGDRMTNPYYRMLREVFSFGRDGDVRLNPRLANWHRGGSLRPLNRALIDILGDPILPSQMWNPDHVLNVDEIQHAEITQDRVDKAAATQLVFEDAMFHVLDFGIRRSGAQRVVLAGGTALNCVASMRLMEHFDSAWFQRYTKLSGPLQMWVPPFPGDAGLPVGAAYHFACLAGAPMNRPEGRLAHPFLCGHAASENDINVALALSIDDIGSEPFGNIHSQDSLDRVSDLMAYIVAHGGVIGLYQGAAESGPRALGHRSILADPTSSDTLHVLNERVKHRERIRPLAPMVTLDAAKELFELSDGAAADDYDAYSYMVMTTRALPIARKLIPAVIHHDGTARIQIVREHNNPLVHAYLRAMGRRTGVEASVNTSLNVGTPIVQTPSQALEALRRSMGMHCLIMISDSGACWITWHLKVQGYKDGGQQLRQWIHQWQEFPMVQSRVLHFRVTRPATAA
ncbi:carbamoyltransferase C-terminal domain-containing protein [Stieleria varia]|uniref:carbamoyltransferase C-terminal domain-containing protein n=1 Tax=Stieleria varia TaxID=2528005 RepID=UPI001E473D6F|nr:carbamoyltransferase C-terminal domain-containing protein [Stieleria varia]